MRQLMSQGIALLIDVEVARESRRHADLRAAKRDRCRACIGATEPNRRPHCSLSSQLREHSRKWSLSKLLPVPQRSQNPPMVKHQSRYEKKRAEDPPDEEDCGPLRRNRKCFIA